MTDTLRQIVECAFIVPVSGPERDILAGAQDALEQLVSELSVRRAKDTTTWRDLAERNSENATKALKLLRSYQANESLIGTGLREALRELGVPVPGYPAPVANAVEILEKLQALTCAEAETKFEAIRGALQAIVDWYDGKTYADGDMPELVVRAKGALARP